MKKILIVEDEPADLNLLSSFLKKEGYELFEATDGIEGLKMAKNEKPDLILLDILMPRMDGMTVLKNLREDEWGKTCRVLILSNYEPDQKIMAKVFEYEPVSYYIKSNIKLEELSKRVKEALGIK